MFTLNCNGRLVTLEQPAVMGILNTTPDSFFAGSRTVADHIVEKAGRMIEDGALIIDLGGQSTRPGSERVEENEEMDRVLPAVEAIHRAFPEQLLSIDTFYAGVARAAVHAGASIVNDVSAGSIDPALIPAVADMRVPYVLMHMQGDPQTMQVDPRYEQVSLEVFDALNNKLSALRQAGIHDVIIDPGFGFGKTISHNFTLLRELEFFRQLGRPLMVGLSRKGTVYKTLGVTPEAALNGTTVLHTIALLNGADIIRVHDVKEAMEAVRLVTRYKEKEQR